MNGQKRSPSGCSSSPSVETTKRQRRSPSGGSTCSVESMSLSSGGEEDHPYNETVNIITNSSFLQHKAIEDALNSPQFSICSNSSNLVSPISSVSDGQSPAGAPEGVIIDPISPSKVKCSVEVANIIANLGLTVPPNVDQIPSHWFPRLCPLIASVVKRLSNDQIASFQERLKRHLYQKEGTNNLSVTLVAASLLRLHPDVQENRREERKNHEILPALIRDRLSIGKFVPIRHILYGEALMEGLASPFNGGQTVEAEPYPLSISRDTPPLDFVSSIRRPDCLRGITTQAITLGTRFPRLASNMHNLQKHLWVLLYQEPGMMGVQAALDLCDAYFREFDRQLCSLSLMSMECFPPYLIRSVQEKHRRNSRLSGECVY